jgi:hypothetical protein
MQQAVQSRCSSANTLARHRTWHIQLLGCATCLELLGYATRRCRVLGMRARNSFAANLQFGVFFGSELGQGRLVEP